MIMTSKMELFFAFITIIFGNIALKTTTATELIAGKVSHKGNWIQETRGYNQ